MKLLMHKVKSKWLGLQKTYLQKKNVKADNDKPGQNPQKSYPLSSQPYVLEVVPTRINTRQIGANWLANFKDNRFSEHGEDGIIAKIFEMMPPTNKWVCEFGAHDPELISNTCRLINQEGWSAVLIEGSDEYYPKLKSYYQNNQNVYCLQKMVSYEGENQLDQILRTTPIPEDLDFMIIDIDGNDYHVWNAINTYRAKLVMIEFNASIPTDVSFVQPRNLLLNQGNSLKAMSELANQKGYKLIAVTSWNAFFVKSEYYHLFFEKEFDLDDMYVYPVKHPIWMRPFQLYDGTIMLAPWDKMLWHNIDLNPNDYQVLPSSWRIFDRKLSQQNAKLPLEENPLLEKIFAKPANAFAKKYARNVFSCNGEDGIIERLVAATVAKRLYYVDVGAWDGVTNSRSRNLAVTHAWHGLLLENDCVVRKQLENNYAAHHKIQIAAGVKALSGETSLDAILKQHHVPVDLDLLLLNVYGMEYYIWESLQEVSPKVIAVQFNPTIQNDVKFIQPNDFNCFQGCSLRALIELAHYKNYELVGVTLETAFFVQRKYSHRLFELFGVGYSELDEMFTPAQMYWFQLYDGTLVQRGLNKLLWHGMPIDDEKLQVVPKALRVFHQHAESRIKPHFYRV